MAGTSSTKESITPAWWIRYISPFDIIKVRMCQLQLVSCYLKCIFFSQVLLTEPRVESVLLTKRGFPIFGTGLRQEILTYFFLYKFFIVFNSRDHLESFSISSGIAFPIQVGVSSLIKQDIERSTFTNVEILWFIQLCVTRLMDLGLDEEGLFRLSAGQAKVRKG